MENRIAAINYNGTGNIGDEMQSLAAIRLLGTPSIYFDRDALNLAPLAAPNTTYWMILNGWFLSRPEAWPPVSCIQPLITSFHLSPAPVYGTGYFPREFLCSDILIPYLRHYMPIGARDIETRDFLMGVGVDSFFSGCMTLTLNRTEVERSSALIVLVDVDPKVQHYVNEQFPGREVLIVTHTDHEVDPARRFRRAEELLTLYSRASCVITCRLHAAMPCVGIETPVLLLDSQHDVRFSGLQDFCYTCTTEEFISGRSQFNVGSPPPPLRKHVSFRKKLEDDVFRFKGQFRSGSARQPYTMTPDQMHQRGEFLERKRTDLLIAIQLRLDALSQVTKV